MVTASSVMSLSIRLSGYLHSSYLLLPKGRQLTIGRISRLWGKMRRSSWILRWSMVHWGRTRRGSDRRWMCKPGTRSQCRRSSDWCVAKWFFLLPQLHLNKYCPFVPLSTQHRDASTSIPFLLNLLSKRGDLTVHLPRSFAGLLFLTAIDNGFHFSGSLSEHLNILDETDTSRKCFVGDIAEFDDTMWEGGWKGDEVILCGKHGVVNIQYTDDPAPLAFPSSQGLPNIYVRL